VPKLDEPTLAARRRRIEEAALRLFRRRGYHGVSLRDVCLEAKVSLGNVYNHFESKERLFAATIERLAREFAQPDKPLARYFASSRFPDDLEELGEAIRNMVEQSEDYLALIFVDVVELEGKHVSVYYRNLVPRVRTLLGPRLAEQRRRGRIGGVDPAVAFAAAYMQFFNYFLVERLFGVKRHMGLEDKALVRELSKLFREGILPRARRARGARGRAGARS
jgi:AcrR family transcriptional regulator